MSWRDGMRKILAVLLAGSVAFGGLVQGVLAQNGATERMEEARTRFQLGEFSAAAEALRGLLAGELEPTARRDATLYLGFCELELGRQDEAVKAFGEVLRLEPDFRPDAAEFPPRYRSAFDEARASLLSSRASDIVSLLEPRGKLSKPTKIPAMFARKWYQKWWVYAIVGAVGIGATAVLVGGGSGYDPPAVTLRVTTPACRDTSAEPRYQRGAIAVEAQVSDGEAPYTLSFSDDNVVAGTRSAPDTAPVAFTYPDVQAPGGGCRNHALKVAVNDANDNGGRIVDSVLTLTVCQCFLPP